MLTNTWINPVCPQCGGFGLLIGHLPVNDEAPCACPLCASVLKVDRSKSNGLMKHWKGRKTTLKVGKP